MTEINVTLERVPQDKVVLVHREPEFGHADFTWGTAARTNVYPAVVDVLKLFAPAGY